MPRTVFQPILILLFLRQIPPPLTPQAPSNALPDAGGDATLLLLATQAAKLSTGSGVVAAAVAASVFH